MYTVGSKTDRPSLDEMEAKVDRAFADFKFRVQTVRELRIAVASGHRTASTAKDYGNIYEGLRQAKLAMIAAIDEMPPRLRTLRELEFAGALAMESAGYVPADEREVA